MLGLSSDDWRWWRIGGDVVVSFTSSGVTSARPLCLLSSGGAVGTLRRLSSGGGFGTGALCLLSSGGGFGCRVLFSPTETTLALRTCTTGLSPPVIDGRRMRGSSDARRDEALLLLRLAIAEPKADPS